MVFLTFYINPAGLSIAAEVTNRVGVFKNRLPIRER